MLTADQIAKIKECARADAASAVATGVKLGRGVDELSEWGLEFTNRAMQEEAVLLYERTVSAACLDASMVRA